MENSAKWIIDRLEGEYAVAELDDKTTVDILLSALPKGVKEGDVIVLKIDSGETQSRRDKINSLSDRLFK